MGVGIALGNTINAVGPALQKGEFVGVSVPIGESHAFRLPTIPDHGYGQQSACW